MLRYWIIGQEEAGSLDVKILDYRTGRGWDTLTDIDQSTAQLAL